METKRQNYYKRKIKELSQTKTDSTLTKRNKGCGPEYNKVTLIGSESYHNQNKPLLNLSTSLESKGKPIEGHQYNQHEEREPLQIINAQGDEIYHTQICKGKNNDQVATKIAQKETIGITVKYQDKEIEQSQREFQAEDKNNAQVEIELEEVESEKNKLHREKNSQRNPDHLQIDQKRDDIGIDKQEIIKGGSLQKEKDFQDNGKHKGGDENDTNSGQEYCLKIVEDFQETEITEYLRDAWKISREGRLFILEKQTPTEEYLNQFPVLRNQKIALELIEFDYAASSPLIDPSTTLLEQIKKYEKTIITLALSKTAKYRDKTQKKIVENIFALIDTSANEDVHRLTGALLLLPFLFSSGGKINVRGRKVSKASRAEVAATFILLKKSLAEGEAAIEERRNTIQSNKYCLQPLVLAVGQSWGEVTSAYVFVDKPLYRFTNILDAVQATFKVFFL